MSGRTPGHWRVEYSMGQPVVVDAHGNQVFSACSLAAPGFDVITTKFANSTLAAAAPEMEEILKELIKGGRYDHCIDRARALLAKIDGGES
jgi:hypothetical protein